MSNEVSREGAARPDDLSRFVVERLNAGDVEGLVALYEPDAVLALPDGRTATGAGQIRAAYERLVAARPTFTPGTQRPTLYCGDLALTSSRLANGMVTDNYRTVVERETDEFTHRSIVDIWSRARRCPRRLVSMAKPMILAAIDVATPRLRPLGVSALSSGSCGAVAARSGRPR